MAEDKAAKSFIEASYNRKFNPYHFSNLVKCEGVIPASMLNRAAIGWFRINEIDFRYGIGDPVIGEMGSRIVHEVLSDYSEIPDYDPSRGFADRGPDVSGTWDKYESQHSQSFVRRGFDE